MREDVEVVLKPRRIALCADWGIHWGHGGEVYSQNLRGVFLGSALAALLALSR